jgi:hypothetical protein
VGVRHRDDGERADRLILALTLSWLPVLVDCAGGPESYVYYEVSQMVGQCIDWESDSPLCGVQLVVRRFDEPRAVVDDLPEPGVGGVVWMDVRAVDVNGNRSDEVCQ